MPQIRIWIILFLLLTASISQAQDENATQGWDIIERCVGQATEPPNDWTYDGTILATGWAGIHGINANWETPHILIFRNSRWHQFFNTGVLSPDGLWYAVPLGVEKYDSVRLEPQIIVDGIGIFSTINREVGYEYLWSTTYIIPHVAGNLVYWFMPNLVWWDSEHLLYLQNGFTDTETDFASPLSRIDILTGEVESMPDAYTFTYLLPHFIAAPSPDWTRIILQSSASPEHFLWDTASEEIIPVMYESGETRFESTVWKPDSTQFINLHNYESYLSRHDSAIYLTDLNGNPLDLIHYNDIDGGIYLRPLQDSWSPDGHYALLQGNTLIIGDMVERVLYDTCLSEYYSVHWSPDSSMLSLLLTSWNNGQSPVQILDIESWRQYTVAYHDGRIIGWREDLE